jgi:hypothetical protein
MFSKEKVLEEVITILDIKIKNSYIDNSLYKAKKIINFRKMTSKVRELVDQIIVQYSETDEDKEYNVEDYEDWIYDRSIIHLMNNYKLLTYTGKNGSDITCYYDRNLGEVRSIEELEKIIKGAN